MQKPINEQYFDLWKELEDILEIRKEGSLPPWKANFEEKIQRLQGRLDELDNHTKQKWLPLFRPVYNNFGLARQDEEAEIPGLMSKYVWTLITHEKHLLSGKLMKLFQWMEFDVLKQPGKCNCQLKHEVVSVLNDLEDLDVNNMKKWEKQHSTVIYQCQECGNYWKYNALRLKRFGVPWKFLGKETEYDPE